MAKDKNFYEYALINSIIKSSKAHLVSFDAACACACACACVCVCVCVCMYVCVRERDREIN